MSFRHVLQNTAFRKLWLAQIVSGFGDRVHEIALLFVVFEQTGNPILVAATAAVSAIPEAVLSLPAGALVDRFDRRRILVVVSAIRGGSVLAIPLVADTAWLVPTILAVAAIAGGAESFASPARNAIVPNVVEESRLDAANALSRMTSSLLRFLYAVGGLLVALLGVEGAFYVDAASFLVAAVVFGTLPTAAGRVDETGEDSDGVVDVDRVLTDAREGLEYVLGNPILSSLVVLSGLLAFVMAPLGVVIPFYSEAVLGGSTALFGESTAVQFGLLYASIYVGIFVGGIGVNTLEDLLASRRGVVIIAASALAGVDLLAIGRVSPLMSGSLLGPAILFGLLGVCVSFVQIPVTTLSQTAVPDAQRGKVFGVLKIPALVAPPVGIGLAGVLLAQLDVFGVLVAMGGAVIGVAGLLTVTPLRGVRNTDPAGNTG